MGRIKQSIANKFRQVAQRLDPEKVDLTKAEPIPAKKTFAEAIARRKFRRQDQDSLEDHAEYAVLYKPRSKLNEDLKKRLKTFQEKQL